MRVNAVVTGNLAALLEKRIEFHQRVNVITGTNGSGKSVILEAINRCVRVLGGVLNGAGEVLRFARQAPAFAYAEFSGVLGTPSSTVRIGHEGIKAPQPNSDNAVIWQPLFNMSPHGMLVHISSHRAKLNSQAMHETGRAGTWRDEDTQTRFAKLRVLYNIIHNQPGDREEFVQEVMRQHFTDEDGTQIVAMRKSRLDPGAQQLLLDVQSHAARHELGGTASGCSEILFLVGETVLLRNSVILIDEPELHLHPKAQDMLRSYLEYLTTEKGGNNQVIIATHSLSLIYGFSSARVINLRREAPDRVVPEHILENKTPLDGYDRALSDLGYSKNAMMAARNAMKEWKKLHNDFVYPGGWATD